MKKIMTIKEWTVKLNLSENDDVRINVKNINDIIKQLKDGGKVDLDNCYAKDIYNRKYNGKRYDELRFIDIENDELQFTTLINCRWYKHKYAIHSRKCKGGKFNADPPFETDDLKELVEWFNTPWEE